MTTLKSFQEPFTQEHLNQLKERYAAIDKIDPCGEAYKKMCEWLDGFTIEALEYLESLDIKWISMLARNRILKAESSEG